MCDLCAKYGKFLPTPSARRATRGLFLFLEPPRYFYPRPPRGGRLCSRSGSSFAFIFLPTPSARRATAVGVKLFGTMWISTHALREEGDPSQFLPGMGFVISTHALREEGDGMRCGRISGTSNFYPRPPRGGRPKQSSKTCAILYFYPRPPRGGRPARREVMP